VQQEEQADRKAQLLLHRLEDKKQTEQSEEETEEEGQAQGSCGFHRWMTQS